MTNTIAFITGTSSRGAHGNRGWRATRRRGYNVVSIAYPDGSLGFALRLSTDLSVPDRRSRRRCSRAPSSAPATVPMSAA